MRFTSLSIRDGLWLGQLEAAAAPGRVMLTSVTRPVALARLKHTGPGLWMVETAIPATAITEGWQALALVADQGEGMAGVLPDAAILATLPVVIGSADDRALAAELALLRAELDVVKRALRRMAAQG